MQSIIHEQKNQIDELAKPINGGFAFVKYRFVSFSLFAIYKVINTEFHIVISKNKIFIIDEGFELGCNSKIFIPMLLMNSVKFEEAINDLTPKSIVYLMLNLDLIQG